MGIHGVAPVLALIVTILGATLSLAVLVFAAFGRYESKERHRITYGKLAIRTDRIVMLLIASLLAAALPLAGYYWLMSRGLADVKLLLVASIEEGPKMPIRKGKATLVRLEGGKGVPLCSEADLSSTNGDFICEVTLNTLQDTFELRVERPGAPGGTRPLKVTEHRVLMTLSGAP